MARELPVRLRPITPAAAGIQRRSLKCAPSSPRTAFNAFEQTSKRRRGFPSETHVKRGPRIVHGDKWLQEKLGRNDLCPCGSGRRFQKVLYAPRSLSTAQGATTTTGTRSCPRDTNGSGARAGEQLLRTQNGVRISPDPTTRNSVGVEQQQAPGSIGPKRYPQDPVKAPVLSGLRVLQEPGL